VLEPRESASGATAEADVPDQPLLRVLVADNVRDAADSLALLVQIWGHEVYVAYDGSAARDLADARQPDVLLLDVAMPKLDGCKLARQLRRRPDFKDRLLVAISGFADDAHRQGCKEAGFNFTFVKPVEPTILEMLLRIERIRLAGLCARLRA
jgi:CheY-like chemotaxis protein